MNKKLEINIGKKPDIVFQFDQFLNVEQAVDKFLNKKNNLEKLIAPLMPQWVEDTIKKIMPKDGETPSDEKLLGLIKPLIPKVENGYTPKKGIDYFDGEDGETPTDEKIISLIKPLIPPVQKVKDGVTPKKWIDYFTKQELQDIKKAIKESILSEIPKTLSKDELTVKFQTIQNILNNMPIRWASYLRQLMDVKMWTLDDLQYGFTYNKSTAQFTLTQITWGGGGSVFVNGVEVTDPNFEDTAEIAITATGSDVNFALKNGSIDETKLDASVNASLDLADTALQPANISDTAYDATSWNGVTTIAPSKNAVRDKIETMDSAIALNTAKVTNATHSGDMTGDTALTAQPAIITGKPSATVASGDLVLIADVNDSNALKQVTAQSIADLGGASWATTALDNLASVAINTSLISDTNNTDDLGSTSILWRHTYTNDIELGHASDTTLTRVSAGVVAVEGKTLVNLTDGGTFAADISVPDEAYGSGWNGSVEVPTKNAIYDKIETLGWWEWTYLSKLTFSNSSTQQDFTSLAAHDYYRLVFNVYNAGARLTINVWVNGITGTAYQYFYMALTPNANNNQAAWRIYDTGATADDIFTWDFVIWAKYRTSSNMKSIAGVGSMGNTNASVLTWGRITGNAADVSSIEIKPTNAITGTVELWYKDNQ